MLFAQLHEQKNVLSRLFWLSKWLLSLVKCLNSDLILSKGKLSTKLRVNDYIHGNSLNWGVTNTMNCVGVKLSCTIMRFAWVYIILIVILVIVYTDMRLRTIISAFSYQYTMSMTDEYEYEIHHRHCCWRSKLLNSHTRAAIWACDKRSWSKVGHTASKSNSQ